MPGAPEKNQVVEAAKPISKNTAPVSQPAQPLETKNAAPKVVVEAVEATKPATSRMTTPVGFGDADDFALGIRDR